MIFSLSLIALTVSVWLYALIRFTRTEGRHAGSWRPLPHRSGSLTKTRVTFRVGSQPEAVA